MALRIWLSALVLALWSSALAADALVLIRSDRAGPSVHPEAYLHGEWMLWAKRSNRDLRTDLLSILTERDWDLGASPEPAAFVHFPRALGETPAPFPLLEGRGIKPDLAVGEAKDWDEVARIARETRGRVLVFEYPPADRENWTRYWFYGKGWPDGLPQGSTGVPGLLRAQEALNLIRRPETFEWAPNETARWGGANRWFEHVRHNGSTVFVLAGIALGYVGACALFVMLQERKGAFAAALMTGVMSIPAATLLASHLDRYFGVEAWQLHFAAAWVLCYGLALAGQRAARKIEGIHPLHPVLAVAVLAFAVCDLRWTHFSPVFSEHPLRAFGAAMGIAISALAGVWCARGRPWLSGLGLVGLLAFLPFGAWGWGMMGLAFLGYFARGRSYAIVFSLATAAAAGCLLWTGVGYFPPGLIASLRQSNVVNVAEYREALLAPASIGVLAFLAGGLLLRDPYLSSRFRRLWKAHPMPGVLMRTAGLSALAGLVKPEFLSSSVMILLTGGLVLLYDAVTE